MIPGQTHMPSFIQRTYKAGLCLFSVIRKTRIIEFESINKIYSDSRGASEVANDEWGKNAVFGFFYPSSSTFGVESAGLLNIVMSLFGSD